MGWDEASRDGPGLRVCGSGVKRPVLAFDSHFHSSAKSASSRFRSREIDKSALRLLLCSSVSALGPLCVIRLVSESRLEDEQTGQTRNAKSNIMFLI